MGEMIKFDYVNEHGDFSLILGQYHFEFTQKGSQIRLCCPFHDDTKPSLSITTVATDQAKANSFYCFGCHEKGSLIDFVASMEETDDLRESARLVARLSGCALAPPRTAKRQSRSSSVESKVVAEKQPAQASRRRPRRQKTGHKVAQRPKPPLSKALRLIQGYML